MGWKYDRTITGGFGDPAPRTKSICTGQRGTLGVECDFEGDGEMDVNENIEKLIEDMRGCKNDWYLFNTKRNELFGVFLDAFQQGYKLRKILNPETTRPAPPIRRCVECWKSRDLNQNDSLERQYSPDCVWCMEYNDARFSSDFCNYFEPKEHEEK